MGTRIYADFTDSEALFTEKSVFIREIRVQYSNDQAARLYYFKTELSLTPEVNMPHQKIQMAV
ncbi:MAG TPA: hypothetical protein DEH22_15310, partial [Chloroflexi bacterium]|nr:hypothetical protein [Chloroflexota bacterium]